VYNRDEVEVTVKSSEEAAAALLSLLFNLTDLGVSIITSFSGIIYLTTGSNSWDYRNHPSLGRFTAFSTSRHQKPSKMPVEGFWPSIDIPDVDLWQLIFGRNDRPFPDDQGRLYSLISHHDFIIT
jgi:hypothetical protein